MKLLEFLLHAFTVIAFVSSTVGESKKSIQCPFQLDDVQSVYSELNYQAARCRESNIFVVTSSLLKNPGIKAEQIHKVFAGYCGEQIEYKKCLKSLGPETKACFNESQETMFRLFSYYKLLDYETGCGNNVTQFFKENFDKNVATIKSCMDDAYPQEDEGRISPNGYMSYEYKAQQKIIECLEGHKGKGYDKLMDLGISVFKGKLGRMKCDQDGAKVLCKTIFGNN